MDSKCINHDEPYQMFCKTCGILICLSCIVGEVHKGHTFEKLKTTADEKRCKLKKYAEDDLPRQEQSVLKKISAIQKLQTQSKETTENARQQAVYKKQSVIVKVEKEFNDIVNELEKVTEKNEKKLAEAEAAAQKTLDKLKDVKTLCCSDLNSISDLEILKRYEEVEQAIEGEGDVTVPYIEFLRFTETQDSFPDASVLFGKMCTDAEVTRAAQAPMLTSNDEENCNITEDGANSENVSVAKEFVVKQTSGVWPFVDTYQVVSAILPWKNGELWLTCFGSKKVSRVDASGCPVQTISCRTSVSGIAALGEDKLLLVGKERVRQFNISTETLVDFVYPKPLYPTAICVTQAGEVFLCLVDSFVQIDPNDDDIFSRVVNLYSNEGELLKTHRKVDGKSFGVPSRIAFDNVNNVICVFDKQFDELIAFDRDSRKRFRRNAKNLSAICYDSHGYLLISDQLSHKVYICDSGGNFLTEITSLMSSPRSLVTDGNGLLVIGCTEGLVKKIKYFV